MRIDPNMAVDLTQEHVLIENGVIYLHDGQSVSADSLGAPGNAFAAFCRTLDPNKSFISAFVPRVEDQELFFQARTHAAEIGVHMQATVEKPDRQRRLWQAYVEMKSIAGVETE